MPNHDFTFAETAIKYLETENPTHLQTLAALPATQHIFNHAARFNPGNGTASKEELLATLLPLSAENKAKIPQAKHNLTFAKQHLTTSGIPAIVQQYLPPDITPDGTLFFTFGYDIGVAFGNNCSLNLAHPIFLNDPQELKYYAIHELHHVGFIKAKGGIMPDLQITTHGEMAALFAYLLHLEGMGTFAPLAIRTQENALNNDPDYIALQDETRARTLAKEIIDIHHHFTQNPNAPLTETAWQHLNTLAGAPRGAYIAGAHMARTIDAKHGRAALTALIPQPSAAFINKYLQ